MIVTLPALNSRACAALPEFPMVEPARQLWAGMSNASAAKPIQL